MKSHKKVRICPICGNAVDGFVPRDRAWICKHCKNFIKYEEFIYERPGKPAKKRKGRGWIGSRFFMSTLTSIEDSSI